MSFKVHSNWDNKINGQIVITNKGDKKIEDWNVSLQSNFKLKQIWNASIEYEEEDEKDNFTIYGILAIIRTSSQNRV